jgi:hypothetical protein
MNHYANAIRIVTDAKTDFKALIVEIAKFNPGVITKAHSRLVAESEPLYVRQCQDIVKINKIEAIKRRLRMRVAKDAVEVL